MKRFMTKKIAAIGIVGTLPRAAPWRSPTTQGGATGSGNGGTTAGTPSTLPVTLSVTAHPRDHSGWDYCGVVRRE